MSEFRVSWRSSVSESQEERERDLEALAVRLQKKEEVGHDEATVTCSTTASVIALCSGQLYDRSSLP